MLNVDSTQAIQYQWFIWRVFGINPPEDNTLWARHYMAYSIAFNVIANVWVPMSLYIKCIMSTSLIEFCETFYILPPVAVQQLKFFNVLRLRSRLKELNVILRQLDKRLQTEEECKIIEHSVQRSNRIFIWVLRLFISVLASSVLHVVFSSEQNLPYPAWFPWDWQASARAYWTTVIFQNLSLYTLVIMTLNNDTYPVSYLNMVAGHFKALSLRISQLGSLPVNNANEQLIECIKDHQTILKLMSTMESTLSVACLFQFVCTAISLCVLSCFIFYVPMAISKLFYLFFMFLSIIVETLLLCNAAEEVTFEGEQLSHAIYACNWTNQSIKFCRSLLIMLHRSQRPISIMAVGLIPVSMTTCLTIVKSSYSMFTLLIDMKSECSE